MTTSLPRAAIDPRILPVLAVAFVVTLGMGMMVPVLPIFAARHGAGAAASGLLLSSFGAARLLMNLPAGAISERYGRRATMTAGILTLGASSLTAASVDSIPALAACLVFNGAGSSLYVTAALAAVADLSTPANRGRLMGLYQAGMLAGISLGPVSGGFLAEAFGPSGPFLAQGGVILAGGLPALALVAETRQVAVPADGGSEAAPRVGALQILRSPAFAALSALMFAAYFCRVVSNWQLVPIMARDHFGYGASAVGLLLTVGAVGQFAALPGVALAVDRWGARPSAIAGACVTIAPLLLMGLWLEAPALWVGVFLLGASGSMLATACSAYAVEQSSGPNGVTMGVLRVAGDCGLVLGPILVGAIVAGTGLRDDTTLLLVGALMALVVTAFALVTRRGRPQDAARA